MQKKDNKPITKNTLISMQVIDSKGQLLGKVKDVVFEVGKAGNSLLVEDEGGETQTVRWEDVQGCADFCVLKPTAQAFGSAAAAAETAQPAASMTKSSSPICPTCGQPLTWIPQYNRWYCYNDKKYV
jgi:sporulation protein YlmC with PRC-barrel domain